ncbi:cellulose synthase subunit BcsC-related outer membrane protein, partial [Ideonella sp.]|uniref:cellulose synthase subunit BcsC-related outer membrane protein n=1 Tax=Ideonella sp. TaxID=1929293 RepID=UPI003BB50663
LSQAARVARARGDTREAERLLRAAIAAEDAARTAAAALPRGLSPAGQVSGLSATSANPFAGITGKRTAGSPALAALPGVSSFQAGGPAYALPGNPLPASVPAALPAAPVLPSARPSPASLYYNPPAASPPAVAEPASAGTKTSTGAGVSSSKAKASRRSKSARGTVATAPPAAPKAAISEGMGYLTAPADAAAIDAARWPALPAAAAPTAVAARAPSFGEVLISPLPRNPRSTALPNAAPTLRDELAELQQVRATTVQVGSQFRRRSGEQGLGALSEFKLPIEAQTQVGEGRISVQVVPTVIDAGPPDPGYNTLSRFGGGPAVSLGNSGTPGSQGDQGVALALGYTVDGLDLRLGTTPLGFRYEDVVGSASWRGTLGDGGARLTAQISRRQMDDSVLTMAGARDVRTSQAWGGMMATGLRMDLAADEGAYEVYGWAAFDRISGHEVADNQKFELGGGLNYRLIGTQSEQLIAGVRLTVLGYEKNQRFFTFGHGGYFSPQSFASLAVPVEWRLSQGKTRYELGGAIGLQAFKESSADYFPDDAVRQAAAVRAATRAVQLGLTDVSPTAVYAGQSKLGLSYELHGRIAYQLSPRLQLIGALGFDNARDYQQFSGGVSLRYAWSGVDTAPAPLLRGFPSTVR